MYKVFFNENSITFSSKASSEKDIENIPSTILRGNYKPLIDRVLEKEKLHINVVSDKLAKAWEDFKNLFTLIEAAGGFVLNEKQETLSIFRLGKWDLPKGKLEENERIEECAIREVEEECGIQNLKITSPVFHTYHTYVLKGESILKRTHWYKMATTTQDLTPQTEEDITEVIWADNKRLVEIQENTYLNIQLVLKHF
jgi:8-oxo-dGTP pyrophosphatase MutT (NUDIX family)